MLDNESAETFTPVFCTLAGATTVIAIVSSVMMVTELAAVVFSSEFSMA